MYKGIIDTNKQTINVYDNTLEGVKMRVCEVTQNMRDVHLDITYEFIKAPALDTDMNVTGESEYVDRDEVYIDEKGEVEII